MESLAVGFKVMRNVFSFSKNIQSHLDVISLIETVMSFLDLVKSGCGCELGWLSVLVICKELNPGHSPG